MNLLCVYQGSVGIETFIIYKKSTPKQRGITILDDIGIRVLRISYYFFVFISLSFLRFR